MGHVVSPAGISTDPAKIKMIQNWPIPKDVSYVHSDLGMFGYDWNLITDDRKRLDHTPSSLRRVAWQLLRNLSGLLFLHI